MTDEANEMALVLPQNPDLVTADVVEYWYGWLVGMAEKEIERRKTEEDITYDNASHEEFEKYRKVLELCGSLETVVEGARQQAIAAIARDELFRYAPENWDTLAEALQDVIPTYSSRGMRHQLHTLASVVAPYCGDHGIPVYDDPKSLWRMAEGASALKSIIRDPDMRSRDKVAAVRREVAFIASHGRDEVRDRYRKPRGNPGIATVVEFVDNQVGLLIVADEEMAEAIRQKVGKLVSGWNSKGTASIKDGKFRQSKAHQGQIVRDHAYAVEMVGLQSFETETGELVEEIW